MLIVAEIGASHGGSLKAAQELCAGAIAAGANMVKLQTYTPDTISFPDAGVCPDGPWKGQSLYEIYKQAHMPYAMQTELIHWMQDEVIPWFSTPFSPEDVQFLEELGCPRYKISSFDCANLPLVAAVRATGKPVILSDGMRRFGVVLNESDIVLRCVSKYPAYADDYGLGDPPDMSLWGISDHTLGSILGIVAISKGACMIEKHIKMDGDTTTPDSSFAVGLSEYESQVSAWHQATWIAGNTRRTPAPDLQAIMPRPVEIDGKTVWRRGVTGPTN